MKRSILALTLASLSAGAFAQGRVSSEPFQPRPPEPAGACDIEGVITGPGSTPGNNCGATSAIANYASANCSAIVDGYPGPEEIWQFQIGAIAATIAVDPVSSDLGIFLVTTCGTGTSCVGFRDTIGDGAVSGLAINTANPNPGEFADVPAGNVPPGTYFAYIDSYYATGPSSCSDYNLVVTGTLPVELTEFSID